MRRAAIAVSALILFLTGAATLVWTNRVPLAEWAIETYQPESPLGPVSVRIRDITLSTISISEIRARFRGPITVQDAEIDYALSNDLDLSLPAIRIGSLNAALSFADWFDLLDTVADGDVPPQPSGLARLPVTVGDIGVETIDLYLETPKGYALLNGDMTFQGTADLSQSAALAQIVLGLRGNLLLSAGAAGFPVEKVLKGGRAMGNGSIVLAASFADNAATIEAVTPISIDLDITESLPGLPELPAGTYRVDIGSTERPFKATLGYGFYPTAYLGVSNLPPFPFFLDTPFGTAEVQATFDPILEGGARTSPLGLDGGMKGMLNLSELPLPNGGTVDVSGGFEFENSDKTTLALDKGFRVSADLAASPLLSAIPLAVLEILGNTPSLSAKSSVTFALGMDGDGQHLTGEGALAADGRAIEVSLRDGFALHLGPGNNLHAEIKALSVTLLEGKAPVSGNASFNDLSAALNTDGMGRVDTRFQLETPQARLQGALSVARTGDTAEISITEGQAALFNPDISIPAFRANGQVTGSDVDLSVALNEVVLGGLRALKRPLALNSKLKTTDRGFDFDALGSIDNVIAVTTKGTYADGDVVLTFGSDEIPLGPDPGWVDLSELTDLIDLGDADPNGSVRVSGEATYRDGTLSGFADLAIAEIGSVLADGTEISVLGTVRFDLANLPATLRPATLTGVLTSGILGKVPFTETFTLRETGEMDISTLEAKFLGGVVAVKDGVADPATGSLRGRIDATEIDLDALANLLSIEGLEGTGRLTGSLNFQLTEDAIIVEQGALHTEQPGILQYRGEALRAAAAGNENLALLVQALENFHYQVLTLGIDIPEFGEGVVTLHLEGNNPDVLDGYPFDVTINLESEYGRLIKTFLNLYKEMDVILQGSFR